MEISLNRRCVAAAGAAILTVALANMTHAETRFAWLGDAAVAADTLASRIAPPPGFLRTEAPAGSWAAWLRALPLKPEGSAVLIYTGGQKWRQDVHVAVISIDVGTRDLQQCADAIMRLRAEWLWSENRKSEIAFNDTDGKRMRLAGRGGDYKSFRKYMDLVFAYAGTYSLERELKPVPNPADVTTGDVFIKGGFPGHAVLVADTAVNPSTGEKRFLLVQSYMPAQEMHVLRHPGTADGSPWYPASFSGDLVTPEWTFAHTSLRRWP